MAKIKKRKPDMRSIRPSKAYLLPEISNYAVAVEWLLASALVEKLGGRFDG